MRLLKQIQQTPPAHRSRIDSRSIWPRQNSRFVIFVDWAPVYVLTGFFEEKWILGLILAHPSGTWLEKQRSETEGVRQRTCRNAHPPSQNAVFQDKCWKGVPKSSPESILGPKWPPKSPKKGPQHAVINQPRKSTSKKWLHVSQDSITSFCTRCGSSAL